jgi:putative endonuclease
VGVTNNLPRRLIEHWNAKGNKSAFTGKYKVCYLLYYESFFTTHAAISREKELKGWSRKKKMALINTTNPGLTFLNQQLLGYRPPG